MNLDKFKNMIFKKRKWSKWEHVMYLEDFQSGIPTFELIKRTCEETNLPEYRKVKIASCVHNLANKLTNERNKIKIEKL